MLYDGGKYNIGWAVNSEGYTQGNVVSNSNLFNFSSNALPAFDAMKYNTDSNDKVLISGKVTKTSTSNNSRPGQSTSTSSNAANMSVTLTVNGEQYTTTTDAYGEYIVAVDYPYSEKFRISADGCSGTYFVDAPADGTLLSGIDFTSGGTADYTAPVYNNDLRIIGRYEGTSDKATALTFSITPNSGIASILINDGEREAKLIEYEKLDYTDNTVVTGEGAVLFGVIYDDIIDDVAKFTISVY
jgi:hypothetical protein